MPKKTPKAPPGALTTDPEVIADLQRKDEYGSVACEGSTDGKIGQVSKRSLEAFERRRLERQEKRE